MSTSTRNLFFIDASVADYQVLTEGLPEKSEWFLLDAGQDGINQIASLSSSYSNLNRPEF